MPVSFDQIPSNIRVPLFYAEVSNRAAFNFQRANRSLLIGMMLDSGDAQANTPMQITSESQAIEAFGQGSQIARMFNAYFRNNTFNEVWALPVAEAAGGVAATHTVTVNGVAVASGTLSLYIAGQRVQVLVQKDEDAASIASNIADAITQIEDLPVTATSAAAVATLTAKHKGEFGNQIDIRLNYLGSLGGEKTPAGITVTMAAAVVGATNPDISDALANLSDEEFDYIGLAFTDATALNVMGEAMDDTTGRWAWSSQIYGHVFSAHTASVAQLTTLGNSRNDQHMTIFGYHDSPTPPWEVSGMVTAQTHRAIDNDPARPLQTLPLIGFLAPSEESRFSLSEKNILLFDGISVLTHDKAGTTRIVRAITTYQVNSFSQPDPSYLDITTLYTLTYILRFYRARITQKFPRHKLADDGTLFGPGQAIVTPNIARQELLAAYREMEYLGLVENYELFKQNLIVERNFNDPNRLDVLLPPDIVNQLRVFAVLAEFRLQYNPVTAGA